MKQQYKNGFLILAGIFILLFISRFIYSFFASSDDPLPVQIQSTRENDSQLPFNIASSKSAYKDKSPGKPASPAADQKYERVATMESRSKNFDNDEKASRDTIKKFGALIQFENRSGLPGRRFLFMAIGVDPEKFEDMVAEIKKIGTLRSLDIVKKDKTNEYKDLNSRKDSLLKARNSLIALKTRGGKIDEFINLENKILELEKEIQKLGIRLGEYNSENEFCTVKMTLREDKVALSMTIIARTVDAFLWAVKIYFYMVIAFALMSAGIFFSIKIYDRGKLIFEKMK